MARLVPDMTDRELETLFELVNRLMKTHLRESEYHELFLKQTQSS